MSKFAHEYAYKNLQRMERGGGDWMAPIPTVVRTPLQLALPKGREGFQEKAHPEPKKMSRPDIPGASTRVCGNP